MFGGVGPERLDELEAISHPAINERIREQVAASTAAMVVLDMAVLTESQLGVVDGVPIYHRVVVVETPLQLRLDRLADRGMTRGDAEGRIAAQASDAERRMIADLAVSNGGSLDELDRIDAAIFSEETHTDLGLGGTYTVTHHGEQILSIKDEHGYAVHRSGELFTEVAECFHIDRYWAMLEDSDVQGHARRCYS